MKPSWQHICLAQQGTGEHWDVHTETALMEKQTAAEGLLQPHPISHRKFSKHGQMFIQGHAAILLLSFSCILFQVSSFAGTDQEKQDSDPIQALDIAMMERTGWK